VNSYSHEPIIDEGWMKYCSRNQSTGLAFYSTTTTNAGTGALSSKRTWVEGFLGHRLAGNTSARGFWEVLPWSLKYHSAHSPCARHQFIQICFDK